MNLLHWLMRAKRWAQHPPSVGRVWLVLAVIALCLLLAGAEHFGLWPESWQTEGVRRGPFIRP